MKQTITRKGNFDSMHRVMNERFKCFRIHGHTYLYELTYSFEETEEIGYAIDFKEIKRIGQQWIEDKLDHGAILNPKDEKMIEVAEELESTYWLMSLNGEEEYCNPSVENIAKELFMAQQYLFEGFDNINVDRIKLHETPKCFTVCTADSIGNKHRDNFVRARKDELMEYAEEKGVEIYDDRKIQ